MADPAAAAAAEPAEPAGEADAYSAMKAPELRAACEARGLESAGKPGALRRLLREAVAAAAAAAAASAVAATARRRARVAAARSRGTRSPLAGQSSMWAGASSSFLLAA